MYTSVVGGLNYYHFDHMTSTMSLPRSDSAESSASEEYQVLFSNENFLTEELSDDTLDSIIRPNREKLMVEIVWTTSCMLC
jgi:hypothetical protein